MPKLFAHQQRLMECLACERGIPAGQVVTVIDPRGRMMTIDAARVRQLWQVDGTRFNTRRLSAQWAKALRKVAL